MKKYILPFGLFVFCVPHVFALGGRLNIRTEDGSVSDYPYQLKVPPGYLVDTNLSTMSLLAPPLYAPYAPETRPYYLDTFWDFFKARPFPVNGSFGYVGISTDTGNCSLTGNLTKGTITATITAGDGVNFTTSEPVEVGDRLYQWQTFQVNSISGDTLILIPKSSFTFVTGAAVQHVWANSSHPSYTASWQAYGTYIANAKRDRSTNGVNMMPLYGTKSVGEFESLYTDGYGRSGVPVGWVSVSSSYYVANGLWSGGYSPLLVVQGGRTNNGWFLNTASTDTGNCGIQLSSTVSVTPGYSYTLTANASGGSGAVWNLVVVDSDTAVTISSTSPTLNSIGSYDTYSQICSPTRLTFTVPQGTTHIVIKVVTNTSGGLTSALRIDTMRLTLAREDPISSRYVIEDPQGRPIALLGDSWGGAVPYIEAALKNRLGNNLQFVDATVSGQTVGQMNARFATDVAAHHPAYCILVSGWMNDLFANESEATMEADIDTFIDNCRKNGIVPVIPGVAPSGDSSITGTLQTTHDRNDQLRARCDLLSY